MLRILVADEAELILALQQSVLRRAECELLAAGAHAVVPWPLERDGVVEALRRCLDFSERVTERRTLRTKVEYSGQGTDGVGYATDICVDGLFLSSRESFRTGDRLRLVFGLPLSERPAIRWHGAGEIA